MRSTLALLTVLAGCVVNAPPEFPEPIALEAGISVARMPVPLGVGTIGNSLFGLSNKTGYADKVAGTDTIFGHPEIKVVVLSRGVGHEMIFVRMDMIGVYSWLRRDVVIRTSERLGRDIDDALIMGATHTHGGPGRLINVGGAVAVLADTFFPEFYDNVVDAVADGIVAAYDDLEPARVGWTIGANDDSHSDRRCQDSPTDYQNPEMPIIAVERNGQIDALVLAYAVHGTTIGPDDFTLTQDVSGGIETGVALGFDHPVEVLFFNSWAADMSVGSPAFDEQAGANIEGSYDRIAAIGQSMGKSVHDALPNVAWQESPEIKSETHRFPLSIGDLGYEGEFDYPYGGVYCGQGTDSECGGPGWDSVPTCLGLTEEFHLPLQTTISAGRVGGLHFITFPGEPGTLLAEKVIADLKEQNADVEQVMFFGYTQDYTGYSILEDDWYKGGYEAGGATWGPKQGAYLTSRTAVAFERTFHPDLVGEALEPFPVVPPTMPEYTALVPASALNLGSVITQVLPTYTSSDVVTFTVAGTDPWLGAPVATIESVDGTPVVWSNTVPVNSDDISFWVTLAAAPAFSESASEREFAWTFNFPVQRKVMGGPTLSGDYKMRVSVPGQSDVVSEAFTVQ